MVRMAREALHEVNVMKKPWAELWPPLVATFVMMVVMVMVQWYSLWVQLSSWQPA